METEEQKLVLIYEEDLKFDNSMISFNCDPLSSDDEELTDDEAFLERHRLQEQEEVKRYNIGLDNKKETKKCLLTPKIKEKTLNP